jgi:ferredoxin/flavodoxin---NADP+ reductase
MTAFAEEKVLGVHHWTDRLFSFRTTRDASFRFLNGQFAMIGIPVDGKPLLRAYSMVSTNHADSLEFLSIKVPNGPLTSRLQHIKPGDSVLVGRKPTGTLVQDSLLPGRTLFLAATGTGLAPFLSIVRDPEVYDRFETLVLVHGCRWITDLAYSEMIEQRLPQDEFIGELVREKLRYYPTVTREPFRHNGRITTLLASGKLTDDLGLPPLDPALDRVMICGGPGVLADMLVLLDARGFQEGSGGKPGSYVYEKAFVER